MGDEKLCTGRLNRHVLKVLLVAEAAGVAVPAAGDPPDVVLPEQVRGPDDGQVLGGHPGVIAPLRDVAEVAHQEAKSPVIKGIGRRLKTVHVCA